MEVALEEDAGLVVRVLELPDAIVLVPDSAGGFVMTC